MARGLVWWLTALCGATLGYFFFGLGQAGDPSVFIQKIIPGGAAARDGRLLEGDKIISVDGTQMGSLKHADAVHVLRNARDTVTLEVYHSPPELLNQQVTSLLLKRVLAAFCARASACACVVLNLFYSPLNILCPDHAAGDHCARQGRSWLWL